MSTVKRALRHLADNGIIHFSNSPHGARFGSRNSEGHVTEAFGIILSPLLARFDELLALADTHAAAAQRVVDLERKCGGLTREIMSVIRDGRSRALAGPWDEFTESVNRCHSARPTTEAGWNELYEELNQLYSNALDVYELGVVVDAERASLEVKMTLPRRVMDHPSTTTTNPISVGTNDRRPADAGQIDISVAAHSGSDVGLGEKPGGRGPRYQAADSVVSWGLIGDACAHMAQLLGCRVDNPGRLAAHSVVIASCAGLRADFFAAARRDYGQLAEILALIMAEKSLGPPTARPARPNDYFRALLRRSESGDLRLVPTLRAMARKASETNLCFESGASI